MTGVVALKPVQPPRPSFDEKRLAFLAEALVSNRFLPMPAPDSIFVGDGDFRAIGAEFLGHLVRLGGLLPSDRVLDIGCGIGRMAVPLTQYLEEGAAYDGFDPVSEGIAWCQETISPAYPSFRFQTIDIAHAIYNPNGLVRGDELVLPYADAAFDFALMVSVTTHLTAPEIRAYFAEASRILAPGGRLFVTAFIMDEVARQALPERDVRLAFARDGEGPCWFVDPAAPLGAVGFDEGFLEGRLEAVGFDLVLKSLGHWRGRKAAHYQDVLVVEKRA